MEKLIKRKVLVSMIFIGLTLMGYFSYSYLPMELYPNAELPMLNVNISATNEFDPKYIESQAAIPVEGVISGLENVEEIKTTVTTRGARINVSFLKGTDVKYAYLKLDEKIKAIAKNIPEEFTVQVNKTGSGMVNAQFMTLLVLGDEDVDYVRNIADADITPILENINGVAAVMVMGGRQKSIEIILDREKCDALNITGSQISALIGKNMTEKSFAGTVYDNKKRYFVNVAAEYLKTEDLGNIVVSKGPVLLKDIAEINFGIKEEDSYSRVNGKEVITCVIAKSPQVNVIDLSKKTRAEIDKLNAELEAKGVSIKVDMDVAETMSNNIDTIINLGVTGAILAIFILYLFLRNFKIVSFIAFAIPISVFSSFYFFYFAGISINTLTLTGIALAVGMLLDNSVVVMENVFRLRAIGVPAEEAAVRGTKEVWKAILAATLTTITVFLPFLFADNFMVKMIGEHIGISIISTLTVSLVVALVLIPMALNYFMSKKDNQVNFSTFSIHSRPVQMYVALLKMCLRKPAQVVITSIVVLAVMVALSLTLTMDTLKEVESDTFNVYITSPSGYTLNRTSEMIKRYEDALTEVEEIDQVNAKIYAEDANLTIKLKKDFKKINNQELKDLKNTVLNRARQLRIRDVSLEARASSTNFQGGGEDMFGGGGDLLKLMGMGSQSEKIVIKGQDFEKMSNLAEYLQYQLEDLNNISYASVSSARGKPESRIQFDQYLMGIYDVTPNNVVSELTNFAPQNTTQIKYKAGDQEYDIIIKDKEVVQAEAEQKEVVRTLDDLRNLDVTNQKGALIDLKSFSAINLTRGQGSINRVNQDKEIVVNYRFNSDVNESKDFLQTARDEIDNLVQATDVPAGLAVEVVHEESETEDFVFLILAAFVIIFMILASVFESLSAPFVLMFAIPLAGIGSLLALLFTSNSLINANVLTGFIILIGIVVNNSIILIDYTSLLRRQGNRKQRALIIAGISRLRPILITAITTIVAMFPLAMGQGEFVAGLGAPFAITVIGGLTMSTLLTLVIILTLYSGMEDALKRLRTQSLFMKILQGALILAAVSCIALWVDSTMWRICYLTMAIILIPGFTWFMESSLRQANSHIIPEEEELRIEVRNLVKIYGRPSGFMREWTSGMRVRERLGIKEEYHDWKDLHILVWLLPITGFLLYFTYSYQVIAFWAILFAALTWILLLKFSDVFIKFSEFRGWRRFVKRIIRMVAFVIYYFLPLITIAWATMKFHGGGAPVMLGILWYAGIAAKHLTDKIHKENINIDLIDGRFRELRKSMYRLATKAPFIGYKKPPFKALNAVSLDIHTGMFGLLGPNGAGKTTLMRIICGIFEQSYGKIFINGIDTQKKREELQGLIGYLPQEFGTYENLTSWEFLEYQALLKGIYDKATRYKRIEEVLEAVHMYENKDKKIGGFSGGMKQRIGIAQTLLNLPRILVVDEPTAGLDPRERIRFRNLLVELSRNRIVIFSTHIIEDIASSCNQVGVINKGSLKYHGTPNEMANIAKETTWIFEIPAHEFALLPPDLLIVHHIRQGEIIRVRCLSEKQPVPQAVHTNPVLEDSYLWLLRGVKLANKEQIITQ